MKNNPLLDSPLLDNPLLDNFIDALAEENGNALADALTPVAPPNDADLLSTFYRSANAFSVDSEIKSFFASNARKVRLSKSETTAWVDIWVAYWKAVGEIFVAEEAARQGKKAANWTKVYEAWRDVVNALHKGYSSAGIPAWTIPCLYVAGKYLRTFAIKADENASKVKGSSTFNVGFQDDEIDSLGKNENLEDAARHISRLFTLCLSDRSPLEDSRKWGLYNITNLQFKTYFKLGSIGLSKNLLRSLQVTQADMPGFESFPKSQRTTFKYYSGVLAFLEEDYVRAEEYLNEAWRLCHKRAQRNRELIMTYLIPCHLLTTHTLPTTTLLEPFPNLQRLFSPLATCIKKGDLAGFDNALLNGEEEFVKRRIYLTLERGRDITLRNLLRKVFLAGGFMPLTEGQTEKDRVRRTRIPVAEFGAALNLSMKRRKGEELETDEVECMLANMIYKNLMKGYIARERGMVVLSKNNAAFPGTGV
ncbi:hypothetical protein K490DRAFT_33379 [Saccharata proteae CBS 121410]|uniref:Protein CSN12 homolog n=1 Tax=Saccharata proteae CBS 121410 TaxID=1314787 RepID=A0A9P4LZA2_9PEZI|nr:hypothetical protein K490DRAFT_33379 [Saccharata proteae CBS 121410]